ncbi:hypothetical protein D9613_010412 [Agrocybe pediades]|uniref:Cytochrome P450 n=1 Tax=Agrocybe pediades TaxID=84607 RepID=A0A8H4QFR3_9AGAR|nr:hypothetical protein D9613_010412 [Agrocybe pediades]KAF9567214.1 putative monooxygenase [Agrocybe pediades]
MEFPSRTTLFVAAVLGGVVLYNTCLKRKKNLPPGPQGIPILGNAHQMPVGTPWLSFAEMGKKFGDIMHFDVIGKPFIIINSAKIARDLLDKRSNIYSDRPHFIMAGDLVGYDETFVLQPLGDNWRKQRRLIAQDFSQSMIPRYHSLQEKEAAILVRNLLKDPSSLLSEIQLRIGIIIVRVTFGYYIQSADDLFLKNPLAAMVNFGKATLPGNFFVDFLPALKYLPRWMPGAGFLSIADEWRKLVWDASWNPYDWCKKNLDTGKTLMPNLCGNYLVESNGKMSRDDELKLVWASSSVMGGGMDTSMSTTLSFLMAMILYPEVQAKAQAEIDSVIGKDRLPLISDRPRLPYVRSILAETFRWAPSFPMGIPHATREDDVYEGYEIPKGALIMPNIWHMLHDPAVYDKPDEFIPERFNGDEAEMAKTNALLFGFGRRVCPGQHFAEGTLFAIMATVLATCDVLPGLDEAGNEVLPKYEYTANGAITFPKPYTLRLRPRSPQATALLAEVQSTIE